MYFFSLLQTANLSLGLGRGPFFGVHNVLLLLLLLKIS